MHHLLIKEEVSSPAHLSEVWRIQIITGTAIAILPTSASFCIIFLMRLWRQTTISHAAFKRTGKLHTSLGSEEKYRCYEQKIQLKETQWQFDRSCFDLNALDVIKMVFIQRQVSVRLPRKWTEIPRKIFCGESSNFPEGWTQQALRAAQRTVSLQLACGIRPMQPSFIATIWSYKVYTYWREAYVISPLLSGHISRFNLRFLITFFMFLPNTDAAPICLPSVGAIVKKVKVKKAHTYTRARAFKRAQTRTPEVNTSDPNDVTNHL